MIRFRARIAARVLALAVLSGGASLVVPAGPAWASASASAGAAAGAAGGGGGGHAPRCLSDNGTDVARYFGLRGDPIWLNLQGQQPPCLTVRRGTFARTHGWIAQVGSKAVYPDDYTPAHREPIVDFLSKLAQARYVISRDGVVEVERVVRGRDLRAHATFGRFGDLFVAPDTTLVPGAVIPAEAPEWTTHEVFDARRLPLGEHTIEIYWTLSDRHCDGFAADPAIDCVVAGETLSTSTDFTVVAR
jgi:hypothetical protein